MAAAPHPWLMPLHAAGAGLGAGGRLGGFEAWYEPGGLWFWLAAGIVAYGVWDFFLSGAYPAGAPHHPRRRRGWRQL